MGLAQLVQFSPYIADAVMIGRIGPTEIAAAAIGSVLYFLIWMLASGPIAAVTPLVSQALGRNIAERRDVRRTVRMSVWACFLIFPFIIGLLLLTEPLMIFAGQDPKVAALAQDYVLVLAPGLPFTLAVMSFRNFLAAIGKTIVPFLLVASAAIVNIILNWVLIFGNLGAPELSLLGAGIASSISGIYGYVIFVIYIKWDERRLYRLHDALRPLHGRSGADWISQRRRQYASGAAGFNRNNFIIGSRDWPLCPTCCFRASMGRVTLLQYGGCRYAARF